MVLKVLKWIGSAIIAVVVFRFIVIPGALGWYTPCNGDNEVHVGVGPLGMIAACEKAPWTDLTS